MNKKNQREINEPLQQITRNLIKTTLRSNTLQEKFINARSAVLSKRLRGRIKNQYNIYSHQDEIIPQKLRNSRVNKIQVCIGTQIPIIDCICDKKAQVESQVSYFKQTLSSYTQTQFQQIQKNSQINKELDFEQIQSKISLQTHETYMQSEDFDSLYTKSSFIKKNQVQGQTVLQQEVNSLKSQIQGLKSQIIIIDQQKNKWKKKALKNSSKIKAIQAEQQRFQKAFSKTIEKQ